MSFGSQYNLNQRITYLESIINTIVPLLPINLANVLLAGNSAGVTDIDLNNNSLLNCSEITSSANLLLDPVGGFVDLDGNTLGMGGGEIHQCPLIHSLNNNNITIEGRGTGDVILKTGTTNRLTITETGAMTFQGGMSYNNATDTLTAAIFAGTATNVSLAENNTSGNFFPVFASGSGSQSLSVDSLTGPYRINPNTGDMRLASTMKIDGNRVAFGVNAGLTTQGTASVAIGNTAGATNQGNNSIAIGNASGNFNQLSSAVAIGTSAGTTSQGLNAVAVGVSSGTTSQGTAAVAVGQNAGTTSQGGNAVAVGVQAGQNNQGSGAVAIGNAAAIGTAGVGQGINAVAVGNTAGQLVQGDRAVAVGVQAGQNTQGADAIAIGNLAAQGTAGVGQGARSVAIGRQAALLTQGVDSVALGNSAGRTSQGAESVSIGLESCFSGQGSNCVAIGAFAGRAGQGSGAIAIGVSAGRGTTSVQGANAIAIGNLAASASQTAGSICLNASGVTLNPGAAGFFVNPIRAGNAGSSFSPTLPANVLYMNGNEILRTT